MFLKGLLFFWQLRISISECFYMPRAIRVFSDSKVYEIVPRTRAHLPMPPTQLSNELKLGILGRTQRESNVELCHFVDMCNHSHNLVVSTTAQRLSKFYMEHQKKTTDTVKALTGLAQLSLWECRPSVARVADFYEAMERIVYIYSNPSKAALCKSIEEYSGLSSWTAFLSCAPCIDAEVIIETRWYPTSEIQTLPSLSISPIQDVALLESLRRSPKAQEHLLVLKPFKWLEPFGITEPYRIENIRKQIITRVRESERIQASKRAIENITVVPRAVQVREPYMKPHKPKKKERRIYLLCSDKQQRIELLREFRAIFALCKMCYKKAKEGLRIDWPPGTFIPWFPPGFKFP
jgi:hypothetical protein